MIRRLFAACALIACLLFAGCRASKPDPETPQRPLTLSDLPRPAADAGPDSLSTEPVKGDKLFDKPTPTHTKTADTGFFGRLFGKKPTPTYTVGMPKKCKGCTFNQVAGNQTNADKKATVAVGDNATAKAGDTKGKDGAVLSQDGGTATGLTGSGNLAQGDGNSQVKQDTTEEAPGWQAKLAGPLGWVLGIVALLAAVYFLPFLFRRRKEPAQPLAPDNGLPS